MMVDEHVVCSLHAHRASHACSRESARTDSVGGRSETQNAKGSNDAFYPPMYT